jgi:hypothetical protein
MYFPVISFFSRRPALGPDRGIPVAGQGISILSQYSVRIVMPDLIRHPEKIWIPAFAGMT